MKETSKVAITNIEQSPYGFHYYYGTKEQPEIASVHMTFRVAGANTLAWDKTEIRVRSTTLSAKEAADLKRALELAIRLQEIWNNYIGREFPAPNRTPTPEGHTRYTVYHKNDMAENLFFPNTEAPKCYTRVAEVILPDNYEYVTKALEKVFELTNTVEALWFGTQAENINVIVSPCRSTSVGDVIIANDKKYVVAELGYREIEIGLPSEK